MGAARRLAVARRGRFMASGRWFEYQREARGESAAGGPSMSRQPVSPVFGARFLRNLWKLVAVYWRSPDAAWGGFLLVLAVLFELWTVWGSLHVADAERRILDALAQRESSAFLAAIGVFLVVTLLFLFASAYRIYIRQALEIRWRRALTAHFVERWIGPRAY